MLFCGATLAMVTMPLFSSYIILILEKYWTSGPLLFFGKQNPHWGGGRTGTYVGLDHGGFLRISLRSAAALLCNDSMRFYHTSTQLWKNDFQ